MGERMENPGVYVEHLQPDAWPFVPFLGLVVSVPLLLLAVLIIHGGRSRMAALRGGLVLAISFAALTAGVVGLTAARDAYSAAEDTNRAQYRQEVHAWAMTTYGLDLSEVELSSLLNQETVLLASASPPQRAHLSIDRANDRIAIVNDLNQTID